MDKNTPGMHLSEQLLYLHFVIQFQTLLRFSNAFALKKTAGNPIPTQN
jgi:hypothetical protein